MARLVCAVSCSCLAGDARAQGGGYAPPELSGLFWGEEILRQPGRQFLRAEIDGSNRPVIVHIPATNGPATGTPLLLVLHKGNGTAGGMENDHQNLIDAAWEAGTVVAFPRGHDDPEGGGYTWSPFGDGVALDDLFYLEGVILWLQHYLPIDTNRTFASGFSAGAGMTQRLAAQRPNRIKAGVAFCYSTGVISTNSTNHIELPAPAAPISMFLVRGGQDTSVPPDGTTPNDKGLIYDSVADQLEFWISAAGGMTNQVTSVPINADTTRHTYASAASLVEMVYDRSLGHQWPGTYDRAVLNWLLSLPGDPCVYAPPELDGDFYFKGECVPNTPGRHYLRTEVGSVPLNTNEVRWIIVHVPAPNPPGTKAPLVLALHGRHQNASIMEDGHTNLIAAAREEGVVLAFLNGSESPDGINQSWEMFGNGLALKDLAYVEGVILWLQHYLPIDVRRTFVSGFSAGGGMAQRVAADRPHRLKAGAAFCFSSGLTNTSTGVDAEIPAPVAPISMFLVRGGQDEKVPPDGTTPDDEGRIYDSVARQLEFWVTAAGGTTNQVTRVQMNPDTTRYTYAGGSTLVEMTFDRSLPHIWRTSHDRPLLDWFLSLPAELAIKLDRTNVVITFANGTLQSAPAVTGPWSDLPGAVGPYSMPRNGPARYFRTRR